MAKYQVNQLKDGDRYWTPKFAADTNMFEASYEICEFGCWGDFADGWAFDNEGECAALCCQMNAALRPFKKEPKEA
jgi:hypothetical protein